jgi:hypothetical protein
MREKSSKREQFQDQQSQLLYYEGQPFQKFKYENVIKMKNKPVPAL